MSDTLGARLREARLEKGLSLRSVAQSLSVSASLVSQVEIGKTQPSVSTLFAMANHLGVSLDEILGISHTAAQSTPTETREPASPDVQKAAENPVIEMENGVRWERLAAGSGGPAEALLVTYEAGASSSIEGRLMRHAGIEYAYLLEGELTLHLDFEVHTMQPGDSLRFDSVRPHLYSNRGTVPAKGIWFVVGRREHNDATPAAPDHTVPQGAPASAIDVLRAMEDLR